MCLAKRHHRSWIPGTVNVLEGGRQSPFLWKSFPVIKVTREDDERKARGERVRRDRQAETNRESEWRREREREAGLCFPAIANHLSLAVLTPQLLLVQSTVIGREPAKRLRKTPTQPLHIRREAKRNRMSLEQIKVWDSTSVSHNFYLRTTRTSELH